jgi:hypothetical protein
MKNFVQPGDVVTVTASARRHDAGRLDCGSNVGGARSDQHGDEGGWHLGRDRAGCLDGVAVVAAGA